jgi:hypothetical protein
VLSKDQTDFSWRRNQFTIIEDSAYATEAWKSSDLKCLRQSTHNITCWNYETTSVVVRLQGMCKRLCSTLLILSAYVCVMISSQGRRPVGTNLLHVRSLFSLFSLCTSLFSRTQAFRVGQYTADCTFWRCSYSNQHNFSKRFSALSKQDIAQSLKSCQSARSRPI